MKYLAVLSWLFLSFVQAESILETPVEAPAPTQSLLDIPLRSEKGEPITLQSLGSGPYVVVNIATRCGFTGQLGDLEKLYQRFKEQGLLVVGVPTNDFAGQTPEDNEGVAEFCRLNYGVSFPVTEIVTVKGDETSPLFKELLERAPRGGKNIRWNFEKFVISKDGTRVERFNSRTKPLSKNLVKTVESML
jgi:glutathione peroxidase